MRILFVFLLVFLQLPEIHAQTQRAEALRNNVVAIEAEGQSGFGFITGAQNKKLFVVTAAHVVESARNNNAAISIKFYNNHRTYMGKIIQFDRFVDIALVEVDEPAGHSWDQNCLGIATVNTDVAFVGREGQWYVPAGQALGTVFSLNNNQIQVDITSVTAGTSGAPLIAESGIIGMIIETDGIKAVAVGLNQIKAFLSSTNYFFTLSGDGKKFEVTPDTELIYKDIEAFKAAQKKDNIPAYQDYIDSFPAGEFKDKAITRIKELEAANAARQEAAHWDIATTRDDIGGYNKYLSEYPNGTFGAEAKRRILALEKQATEKTVTTDNGTVVTDRDGNTYPTKTMADGHRWMTKNLNLKVNNSWCYKDDPSYCAKYGRLYTWEAAKEACEALDGDWRLPADEQWKALGEAYGGYYDWPTSKDVGNPKSAYEALFGNGSSGFAAQLGGWRDPGGSFFDEGSFGYYWSSSPSGSSGAWSYGFSRDSGKLLRINGGRGLGFSVRCRQGS